jgi:hypothetical protein
MTSKKKKKKKVNFWFMRDNHTFKSIVGKDLREIALEYIRVAKENPYGIVCEAFIDNKRIGKSLHVDKHGDFNIKEYFGELLKDENIRNIFDYGEQ